MRPSALLCPPEATLLTLTSVDGGPVARKDRSSAEAMG